MHTDERKRRISEGVKLAVAAGRFRRGGWKYTDEAKRQKSIAQKAYARRVLLGENFEVLSSDRKSARVKMEQDGRCANCGLAEWLGRPICLELDHKNGDRKVETRDNLWAICPNCHSQTKTWRGRNVALKAASIGTFKVSDEALRKALKSAPSIRQALLAVGLRGEGNNYERARRLVEGSRTADGV